MVSEQHSRVDLSYSQVVLHLLGDESYFFDLLMILSSVFPTKLANKQVTSLLLF